MAFIGRRWSARSPACSVPDPSGLRAPTMDFESSPSALLALVMHAEDAVAAFRRPPMPFRANAGLLPPSALSPLDFEHLPSPLTLPPTTKAFRGRRWPACSPTRLAPPRAPSTRRRRCTSVRQGPSGPTLASQAQRTQSSWTSAPAVAVPTTAKAFRGRRWLASSSARSVLWISSTCPRRFTCRRRPRPPKASVDLLQAQRAQSQFLLDFEPLLPRDSLRQPRILRTTSRRSQRPLTRAPGLLALSLMDSSPTLTCLQAQHAQSQYLLDFEPFFPRDLLAGRRFRGRLFVGLNAHSAGPALAC